MAARPPTNDGEEPEIIEFGIAAVDARLEASDLEFPADADEVAQALGDEVPYDANGREIPIATAIDETGNARFEDRQELLNALHPVFEDRRNQPLGLIDRLRGLWPL